MASDEDREPEEGTPGTPDHPEGPGGRTVGDILKHLALPAGRLPIQDILDSLAGRQNIMDSLATKMSLVDVAGLTAGAERMAKLTDIDHLSGLSSKMSVLDQAALIADDPFSKLSPAAIEPLVLPPNPVYEQIQETRSGLANVAEILGGMATMAREQLDAQGDLIKAIAAVEAETLELRQVTAAAETRAEKSERTMRRLTWLIAALTVLVVVLAVAQIGLTVWVATRPGLTR